MYSKETVKFAVSNAECYFY